MHLFNKRVTSAALFLAVLVGPFAWIAACYFANQAIVGLANGHNPNRNAVTEVKTPPNPNTNTQDLALMTTGPLMTSTPLANTNAQHFASVVAKITEAQTTLRK